MAVDFVFGFLADATCVEEDEVGFGEFGGFVESEGLEVGFDALGVGVVHLAAEGLNEVVQS